ncbi:MAG: hypothetical protein WB676_07570 [Bryobacteraceae bacterium]
MTAALSSILLWNASVAAGEELTQEQLDLLHDSKGWEYTAIFDKDNGFPMNHQCFVEGHPNSDACRGTMTVSSDSNFVQDVYIHGAEVQRHGTYELDGNQITLQDEFGTNDGPYTVDIDPKAKTMRFTLTNAGDVRIGADFLLERQYQKSKRKPQNGSSQNGTNQ